MLWVFLLSLVWVKLFSIVWVIQFTVYTSYGEEFAIAGYDCSFGEVRGERSFAAHEKFQQDVM